MKTLKLTVAALLAAAAALALTAGAANAPGSPRAVQAQPPVASGPGTGHDHAQGAAADGSTAEAPTDAAKTGCPMAGMKSGKMAKMGGHGMGCGMAAAAQPKSCCK